MARTSVASFPTPGILGRDPIIHSVQLRRFYVFPAPLLTLISPQGRKSWEKRKKAKIWHNLALEV